MVWKLRAILEPALSIDINFMTTDLSEFKNLSGWETVGYSEREYAKMEAK